MARHPPLKVLTYFEPESNLLKEFRKEIIMLSYAIWNNKGGTGKSTITFHVASRYAERNPDKNVLVIDLCPQANSSMLFLGGGLTGETSLLKLCSGIKPQSVVGFLSDAFLTRKQPDYLTDFTINIQSYNKEMPKNISLLAGDGNLELMAPALNDEAARTPFPGLSDPWLWVHSIFLEMCQNLDESWTVFYDTNPSFSIYTELAICGSQRLIVPVNADDASRVAVKALFALLYGTTPPHQFFGNYTFAAKASARQIKIPLLHLAVGNRFTQFKGPAAAFAAFSQATADQLYQEYMSAPSRFTAHPNLPSNKSEFLSQYVAELRDFNTAGVVAAHHGAPLARMKQDYYSVHNDDGVKVNKAQIVAGLKAIDELVDRL
jgi:cellulose biosynthesis protein BcsQ